MTTNADTTIMVEYKLVDGAHFFTGKKEQYALGLCVANKDLKIAFDEVVAQLTTLLEVNHGIKAKVTSGIEFKQFEDWVVKTQIPPTPAIKPKSAAADITFAYHQTKKAA